MVVKTDIFYEGKLCGLPFREIIRLDKEVAYKILTNPKPTPYCFEFRKYIFQFDYVSEFLNQYEYDLENKLLRKELEVEKEIIRYGIFETPQEFKVAFESAMKVVQGGSNSQTAQVEMDVKLFVNAVGKLVMKFAPNVIAIDPQGYDHVRRMVLDLEVPSCHALFKGVIKCPIYATNVMTSSSSRIPCMIEIKSTHSIEII